MGVIWIDIASRSHLRSSHSANLCRPAQIPFGLPVQNSLLTTWRDQRLQQQSPRGVAPGLRDLLVPKLLILVVGAEEAHGTGRKGETPGMNPKLQLVAGSRVEKGLWETMTYLTFQVNGISPQTSVSGCDMTRIWLWHMIMMGTCQMTLSQQPASMSSSILVYSVLLPKRCVRMDYCSLP